MDAPAVTAALKFDPIEVDVALAEKYLLDHSDDIKDNILPEVMNIELEESKKYKKLIEKIKENSKLICQLEYLQNKTPIEISEKNLQLILKWISLDRHKYTLDARWSRDIINFKKESPLALLCFVCTNYVYNWDPEKAACHLFVTLCRESGFLVSFSPNTSLIGIYKELNNIGVISERSDLDSAVDAFLSSPSNSSCFWRLHRIYVQESIFESFIELLDIKMTLKGTKGKENEELKQLCSELFVYDEKCLLIDYAGDMRAPQLEGVHAIFVEAYRTNKELLSLVDQETGCVSLWSSDVAEANELAYSIPASLVWINDYENFDGPPEISTVLLSLIESDVISCPTSFCNHYNIWKTYSKDQRISILCDVLEREVSKLNSGDETVKEKTKEVLDLLKKIYTVKFNTVDVADNKICVTLNYPVGFHWVEGCDVEMIIHSLVIGNGVIGDALFNFPFCDELSSAGVPIKSKFLKNKSDNIKVKNSLPFCCKTKVVLTNFGTIFAN